SVADNINISVRRQYAWGGLLLDKRREAALAEEYMSKLHVRAPNRDAAIATLSGGNQQKVLLGRWLLTRPGILILDEPTRGVDVAAKAEIHALIAQLAAEGTAVLMISSELPEILAMSHRIMVMRQGRVSGVLERAVADQVAIMELAAWTRA
ncbi:MAG TPA: ATP-binding cassette domain-containing protein, partial [Steroidobacteraceae bacterium]|nr:ATP-binding cassette domain-containing protein [Steroidobacteraceae bacterium]